MPRNRDERLRVKQEVALTDLAAGKPCRLEIRRSASYAADPSALVLEAYIETDMGRYRSNPDFELTSHPGQGVGELLATFAELLIKFAEDGPAQGQLEVVSNPVA